MPTGTPTVAFWNDDVVEWDSEDWTWDGQPVGVPPQDTPIDRRFRIGKRRGGSKLGGLDRIGGQLEVVTEGSFHLGGPTGSKLGGSDKIGGSGGPVVDQVHGSVALSGDGSLALGGTRTTHGSVALSGDGSLDAAGTRTAHGACGFSGAGDLVLQGTRIVHGGTLALLGAGSLSASGTRTIHGSVALLGQGSLNLSGAVVGHSHIDVSGTGTLTATGVRTVHGSLRIALLWGGADWGLFPWGLTYSGLGALMPIAPWGQADWGIIPWGFSVSGYSGFTGSGTLALGQGHRTIHGSVNLTGDGDLTFDGGHAHHHASVVLSGAGSLTADGTVTNVGRPVNGPTISKMRGGPSRVLIGVPRTRSDLVGAHDDG